jgi:hypothetical protein
MGELYEDRRQEPRFTTGGRSRLQTANSGEVEGRILDLSLNGALLECSGKALLQVGARHAVVLECDGQPSFRGDALLVRVEGARVGIEFYDMDPQNFAALTGLIEALRHQRR